MMDGLPGSSHPEDNLGARDASRPQQFAKGALVLLLTIAGLWTLHNYLTALLWAAILAIAVWPLYRRVDAGRGGVVWPAVFTAALALIFILPLALVAYQAGKEVRTVYHTIDEARTQGIEPPQFLDRLPYSSQAKSWWQDNLSNPDHASALIDKAQPSRFVTTGRELGAQIAHRGVLFFFTLLTLFFLFKEAGAVTSQLRRASSRAFGPSGERIGRQMIASVHGTVDGLVLVGLGEGVIMGIAYFIAGVPHPTLFGLFTAVAAMVPFGAPVAFGIAAVLLLVKGTVVWAISIFVLGMIVSFSADHFVRPQLIGSATRLPFLWVLLGILGGVETWGLIGLFLGPAIMAALILLWREWSGQGATDKAPARPAE